MKDEIAADKKKGEGMKGRWKGSHGEKFRGKR